MQTHITQRWSFKENLSIYFYYFIWESLVWYKREQLAQMAFPIIATLITPITTTKWGGVKLFWLCTFPFE